MYSENVTVLYIRERGCGSWFYYKLLSKNERGGVLAILLSKGN